MGLISGSGCSTATSDPFLDKPSLTGFGSESKGERNGKVAALDTRKIDSAGISFLADPFVCGGGVVTAAIDAAADCRVLFDAADKAR